MTAQRLPSLVRLAALCAGVTLALATTLTPTPASACGGTFCSRPTPMSPRPEPVDQSAERIVFQMHGDNTVSAHVQISYAGSADDFAWVVPVPGVPNVSESSTALFDALDSVSRLDVTLPAPIDCAQPSFQNFGGDGGGDSFACGPMAADSSGGELSSGDRGFGDGQQPPVPFADSPVTVYDNDFTANYEYAVIGARDPGELVGWLQANGYNVSDNMTPVIEVYDDPGMRFLALKLRDGKQARDVVPIALRYVAVEPMIPIQLTAVAAQPYMGIQVFILADEPYVPRNYDSVRIDARELLYRGDGTVNYFDWVAREVEEAGGHRFITEFVGEHFLGESVGGAMVPQRFLSRYYTRLSPEHMTLDPTFRPATHATLRVSNAIDLTQSMPLFTCDDAFNLAVIPGREPSACAFNYCGPGATCYEEAGQVGCLCPEGRVAQQIAGPDGGRKVVCTPQVNPYAITDEAGGAGTPFDPCADYACGAGTCVLKGGFPTCVCDPDAIARLDLVGSMTCTPLSIEARSFGPGAGLESAGEPVPVVTAAVTTPNEPNRGLLPLLWLPVAIGLGLGVSRLRR